MQFRDSKSIQSNLRFDSKENKFAQIRKRNLTYVDKSMFVKHAIEGAHAKYSAYFLPSGFGKSVNLSMVSYFLDAHVDNAERERLTQGLAIRGDVDFIREHEGKYHVVYLDLSQVKGGTFKDFLKNYQIELSKLIKHFLASIDKKKREEFYLLDLYYMPELQSFLNINPAELINKSDLIESMLLKFVNCISKYYDSAKIQREVIILVDGADIPLVAGFQSGYYEKVAVFIFRVINSLKDENCFDSLIMMATYPIFNLSIGMVWHSFDRNNKVMSLFGYTEEDIRKLLKIKFATDSVAHLELVRQKYKYTLKDRYDNPNPFIIYPPAAINNDLAKLPVKIGSSELILAYMKYVKYVKKDIELNETTKVDRSLSWSQNVFLDPGQKSDMRKYNFFKLLYFSGYLTDHAETFLFANQIARECYVSDFIIGQKYRILALNTVHEEVKSPGVFHQVGLFLTEKELAVLKGVSKKINKIFHDEKDEVQEKSKHLLKI